MPDSSEIDAAVTNRLLNDSTLAGLMPDGVYFDVGGHGKTQFVIVSQVDHQDEAMFGATAFERVTYLVKAVENSATGANIKAAAARIQTLLHRVDFAITGYGLMTCKRIGRIRYTEVDEEDHDVRWQHRGGHYELMVSPGG